MYMPSHWGLIFVDVANGNVYFDDGLKSTAPPWALASVKKLLELLLGPLPIHNFQWRYCDMDLHRKQLMMQILNWSVQV